jgi:hypothetical protein
MPAKRKASSETSTAMAGFFLANGPAVAGSSNQSGEGDIRRALIEADREMTSNEMRATNRVFSTSTFELHSSNFATALSGQLFNSTQIPAAYGSVGKMKPLAYVATRLNSNSP